MQNPTLVFQVKFYIRKITICVKTADTFIEIKTENINIFKIGDRLQ